MKIIVCPECKFVDMVYDVNIEAEKYKCPQCGHIGIKIIEREARK